MDCFVFVLRMLKIYSLNKFLVYNIVHLNIVNILYIRSLEIIHLITGSLYPLSTSLHSLQSPTPSLWQSLFYSLVVCVQLFNILHIIKIIKHVFLCLISLSTIFQVHSTNISIFKSLYCRYLIVSPLWIPHYIFRITFYGLLGIHKY